jgi:hypothetical protein
VLGIFWAVWRWRSATGRLLLVWVALTALLGGALMAHNPGYARYVVATPAIAILAAMGVAWTIDLFIAALPRLRDSAARKRYAALAAGGVMALLAGINVTHYFQVHIEVFRDDMRPFAWQTLDLRERIDALPDETQVYVLADIPETCFMIDFFFWDRPVTCEHSARWNWDHFAASLPAEGMIMFVAPEQYHAMDVLQILRPGSEVMPSSGRALRAGRAYARFRLAAAGE